MHHYGLHAICCSLLRLGWQSMLPCVLLLSSLHVLILSQNHPIKILFLIPFVLFVSVIFLISMNLLLIMIGCQIVFLFLDSIHLPCSISSHHLLLFYSHGLLLLLMLIELRNLPYIFRNQGQMQILLIHLFLPLFNLLFIFLFLPMLAFYFSSIFLIFSHSLILFKMLAILPIFIQILFNMFVLLVVEHLSNHFLGYFNLKVTFFTSRWLFVNFLLLIFLVHFLPKFLHVLYFF
jgi:hypothetical protein